MNDSVIFRDVSWAAARHAGSPGSCEDGPALASPLRRAHPGLGPQRSGHAFFQGRDQSESGTADQHSEPPTDAWPDSGNLFVVLSFGTPYAPTSLPTVGSRYDPLLGYARNPVVVRCVARVVYKKSPR